MSGVALTAPNSSGTGGTGSMRYFEKGQREQRLILHRKQFPHWWVDRLYQFGGKEERLPFDAHTAKALIAPRALMNAHAKQDYWANPYGTELTYRCSRPGLRLAWREGAAGDSLAQRRPCPGRRGLARTLGFRRSAILQEEAHA